MNRHPAHQQFPVGPLVAALGAVLLIVSLFLDWWEDLSAFTIFEVHDLLLLILALAAIAALAHGMGLLRHRAAGDVLLPVALLALLIVVSQIINHPPAAFDDEKDIGIWLALAATLLMTAGAILDRTRISLAVETRPRRGPGGAAAPGGPGSSSPEPSAPVSSRDPGESASAAARPAPPAGDSAPGHPASDETLPLTPRDPPADAGRP